jgi:hypothetical protein
LVGGLFCHEFHATLSGYHENEIEHFFGLGLSCHEFHATLLDGKYSRIMWHNASGVSISQPMVDRNLGGVGEG